MPPAPITATPRLTLRGWRERDRAPFAAINQDLDVMRYLGPLVEPPENTVPITE